MFYMKNKEGNAYKKVNSVRKKEALETLGYTVVNDDGQKVADVEAVEPPVEPPKDDTKVSLLDGMNVSELKTFAKDNNIEITATKKDDILDEIKKAVSVQVVE